MKKSGCDGLVSEETKMNYKLIVGDALETLRKGKEKSVQCCVTSPPYFGLRSYIDPQNSLKEKEIGTEKTPSAYIAHLVEIFGEIKRLLVDNGTLWVVIGDSYNGSGSTGSLNGIQGTNEGSHKKQRTHVADIKPKDLLGIPWMLAFALRDDGWYLRSDIIWAKSNPMPESVKDRPTRAHEYIFLFSKSKKYYYDNSVIMEDAIYGKEHAAKGTSWGTERKHPNKKNVADYAHSGDNHTTYRDSEGNYKKNRRSVWFVPTRPHKEAHFAVFPTALIEPCILAGSRPGDFILDPFCGSGTTGVVALKNERRFVGIDLKPEYIEIAEKRIQQEVYGK